MKIAAVGDIHLGPQRCGFEKDHISAVNSMAEVLVVAGDLTNYGTTEEIEWCLNTLSGVKIPIVAVLGNHDFESNQQEKLITILRTKGVHLLDGDCIEFGEVGFAGVKGFGGGFGRYQLAEFGEPCIKSFVTQSQNEAQKLRQALLQLTTPKKVAVLHYAPIRTTIEGEPAPIHPFLGSTDLEVVLDETLPDLAVHGHAHKGCFEGKTSKGVRVCNVALPILRANGEKHPFTLFDI